MNKTATKQTNTTKDIIADLAFVFNNVKNCQTANNIVLMIVTKNNTEVQLINNPV